MSKLGTVKVIYLNQEKNKSAGGKLNSRNADTERKER